MSDNKLRRVAWAIQSEDFDAPILTSDADVAQSYEAAGRHAVEALVPLGDALPLARRVEELERIGTDLIHRRGEAEEERDLLLESVSLGRGEDPGWAEREQEALRWLHGGVKEDGPRGLAATLFAILTEWTESYSQLVQEAIEWEERAGELEADRDALLALGRVVGRLYHGDRSSLGDDLDALFDAYRALLARLRERLEADQGKEEPWQT